MEIQPLVAQFKEYLLASAVKTQIAKVILFGSQVKGTATDRSDIDILIVTTDGKEAKKRLLDTVYDFMIEQYAPIEVMTAPLDDLIGIHDYFLYNIIHYGTEVYTMEQQTLKHLMVKHLRQLAEEYLDSAQAVLLTLNRLRLAIDAAYNAAELAAKGLILLKQDDLPGSHGGVVSVFGQLYVKTGEVDKDLGRALNRALQLRNEARYKPDAMLSQENASFVLDLAQRLIELLPE